MTEIPVIEGAVSALGCRVAIVAARFNDFIVASLLKGAVEAWRAAGGAGENLTVARVPGAFELPLAIHKLGATRRYDALVALGCVIRGDTPHFDYVAGECAKGLSATALEYGVPVGFGVITADNAEQADARAQPDEDHNKGAEAASAVIEMVNVLRQIDVEDE